MYPSSILVCEIYALQNIFLVISILGNRVAQLSYSFNLEFPNATVLRGSGGSMTVNIPIFKGSPNIETPTEKLEFPLPVADMELNFPTSKGLRLVGYNTASVLMYLLSMFLWLMLCLNLLVVL